MPVISALRKDATRRRRREEQGTSSSDDSDADYDTSRQNKDDEEGGAAGAAPPVPTNSASRAKSSKAAAAAAAAAASASSSSSSAEKQKIKFIEPTNWVERMSLVANKPLPAGIDPDDDPKREEAFVEHALLSVNRGVQMLDKAQVPWRRPGDYYAEMYKSDVHMDKIRNAINSTKAAVQERMKRRMVKEQKQFGKQVQADVLRQRAQEKRSMMAKVNELRKRNKGSRDGSNKLSSILGDDDDDDDGTGKFSRRGGAGGRKQKHHQRGAAFRQKNLRPGGGGGGKKGGGGGAKRAGKSKRR